MQRTDADGDLDALRGYKMFKRNSISQFAPHPSISTICVGCCSVSLQSQHPHPASPASTFYYFKSLVPLQRQAHS